MRPRQTDIYGGKNPEDVPAYGISQAAHYLGLPVATIRSWAVGRKYPAGGKKVTSPPLISIASPGDRLLSFRNLAELHVLSSLRHVHNLELRAVRSALVFLTKKYRDPHPLLRKDMLTDGRSLFIQRYENYVNLSTDGQLEMADIIDVYVRRIDRDSAGMPIRLFPVTRSDYRESPKVVSIDPRVRFGRPCIASTGIPTMIVAERFRAGDILPLLAKDYGRPQEEIEEAIRYESRIAS